MGGGGAVILRSLLQERDRKRMVWGSPLLAPGDGASAGTLPLRTPAGRLRRWLGRRSLTVDSLFSGAIADAVASSARNLNARAIWIVMHGAMVHVAARISERTNLPFHLSVHDDPPYGVGLMSRRHLGLIPLVARDLGLALRRARSIDVISAGMARRYETRYGAKSVVVHRGIQGPVNIFPTLTIKNGGSRSECSGTRTATDNFSCSSTLSLARPPRSGREAVYSSSGKDLVRGCVNTRGDGLRSR